GGKPESTCAVWRTVSAILALTHSVLIATRHPTSYQRSNCCKQPPPRRECLLARKIRIQHCAGSNAHLIASWGILGKKQNGADEASSIAGLDDKSAFV